MPFINHHNIQTYYETTGQGEAIIFVPGFAGTHEGWLSVAPAFASRYQTVLLDNRCAGQSSVIDQSFSIEDMAKDVMALCDFLKIQKAHFIGVSMGGAIVQTIARHHSDRVYSAVIENSFMKLDEPYAVFLKARLKLFKEKLDVTLSEELNLGWCFSSWYLQQPNQIDQLLALERLNPHPFTEVGFKRQLEAMLAFNSQDWVSEIKAPCLFLTGKEDLIAFPAQSETMARVVKNASFYAFDHCGHLPHIEYPKEFSRVVLAFLGKHFG